MTSVKLAFFFQAKYWHKRARTARLGYFVHGSALPIRCIERDDVAFGFQFRGTPPNVVDIGVLVFDNKLWWPVSFGGAPVTLADLQVKLSDPESDFLGIGPEAPFRRTLDDSSINRINTEQADEVLNRASQKISDNVLVCGGLVYARGGEPVFIPAPRSGASTPWSELNSCFVNPGADRAADSCAKGLRWQPGGCATRAVQACLRNGAFLTMREMRNAACDFGESAAAIKFATRAPSVADAIELQVDACFRELWRLKRRVAWASAAFLLAKDPRRESAARQLKYLTEEIVDRPDCDSGSIRWETTVERAALIGSFVAWVDDGGMDFHRPDLLSECRQLVERFDRSNYRTHSDWRPFLAPEDAESLCQLDTADRF